MSIIFFIDTDKMLGITSDQIRRNFTDNEDLELDDDYIAQISNLRNDLDQLELELYDMIELCPEDLVRRMKDRLSRVDASMYSKLYMDKFYDSGIMATGQCILETLKYGSSDLTYQERIKYYFSNIKRIGSGVTGDTSVTDLDMYTKSRAPFVIKSVKPYPTGTGKPEMIHEALIGLLGTNKLRSCVINFAFIIGTFECSNMLPDYDTRKPETKRVYQFCDPNAVNQNVNIVYENIAPSVSLKSFVSDCTGKAFINIYLQTILALRYANNQIDFTHYDLHHENVLVKNTESMVYVRYPNPVKGSSVYIRTDSIPIIIDFGTSHITHNGNDIGDTRLIKYNVMPDRSYPLYDAYKMLMFSLEEMVQKNNDKCVDYCRSLLKYFSDESVEQILDNQFDMFFMLPYSDELRSIDLMDLIDYIVNNYDCSEFVFDSVDDPEAIMIGCSRSDLYNSIDQILGVDSRGHSGPNNLVNDIVEYYDYITDPNRSANMKLNNPEKAFSSAFKKLNATLNEIRMTLETADLTDRQVAQLMNNRDLFYIYYNSIREVAKDLNLKSELNKLNKVDKYIVDRLADRIEVLRKN